MSPEDSANLPAKRLAVPDYYAHVLMEYSDKELKEAVRVAQGGDEKVGDSGSVIERWGKYKEVQIHGDISFKTHVERLVVPDRLKDKKSWVGKVAKAHGWKVTWMSDMEKELRTRSTGRVMDQETWQDKLDCIRRDQEQTLQATKFVTARETAVKWMYEIDDGWQLFDGTLQGPLESLFQEYMASPSATGNWELSA
ncbi:unnamed protein product [Prorocentrum cordatum]|uniref:DNA-directed DNA polymerase n=1 Tax=Prorocentrum cordatum TaxID=2364126 RepID=A0ABN9V7K2_9DINO|nr:unnamed protein product [Polarella glacialis]